MIKLVQNTEHGRLMWAFGFHNRGNYLDQITYYRTNSDIRTAVNNNKVLLISSIHAACCGRTDHPHTLKCIALKSKTILRSYFGFQSREF